MYPKQRQTQQQAMRSHRSAAAPQAYVHALDHVRRRQADVQALRAAHQNIGVMQARGLDDGVRADTSWLAASMDAFGHQQDWIEALAASAYMKKEAPLPQGPLRQKVEHVIELAAQKAADPSQLDALQTALYEAARQTLWSEAMAALSARAGSRYRLLIARLRRATPVGG